MVMREVPGWERVADTAQGCNAGPGHQTVIHDTSHALSNGKGPDARPFSTENVMVHIHLVAHT